MGEPLQSWAGTAELELFRSESRTVVVAELHRNPARIPGLTSDTWAGSFRAQPFTILQVGRGAIHLPDGTIADVMLESYDTVTGEGFVLGALPEPPF